MLDFKTRRSHPLSADATAEGVQFLGEVSAKSDNKNALNIKIKICFMTISQIKKYLY
jgi:hypothetical protein